MTHCQIPRGGGDLFPLKRAAEYLGIPTERLRILVKKGTMPATKRGQHLWVFFRRDLDVYLETKGVDIPVWTSPLTGYVAVLNEKRVLLEKQCERLQKRVAALLVVIKKEKPVKKETPVKKYQGVITGKGDTSIVNATEPEEDIYIAELRGAVQIAMTRLSQKDQYILHKVFYEDFSFVKVGGLLCISRQGAQQQSKAALNRLRRHLLFPSPPHFPS